MAARFPAKLFYTVVDNGGFRVCAASRQSGRPSNGSSEGIQPAATNNRCDRAGRGRAIPPLSTEPVKMQRPLANQPFQKNWPKGLGAWISFDHLPKGFSDADLRDFLLHYGIELPLEHCSIKSYSDGSAGMVLMTRDDICRVFNWLLDGAALGGRPVIARGNPNSESFKTMSDADRVDALLRQARGEV